MIETRSARPLAVPRTADVDASRAPSRPYYPSNPETSSANAPGSGACIPVRLIIRQKSGKNHPCVYMVTITGADVTDTPF
jgi:hypothetical protein